MEGEMKIDRESFRERWGHAGRQQDTEQESEGENSPERESGIPNHHQQGKYCFEIGHATMQRLLAPNSFCRTLQK